jgi:hypothetical protein
MTLISTFRPFDIPARACLAVAVLSTGCRGEDISFDCENQAMRFLSRSDAESHRLGPIPERGPYPAAMSITEDGLNRLVESIIAEGVPFAGTIPFNILPQGPGDAEFEPESAPRILLRPVRGCPNCVVFAIDFTVALATTTEPLSTGVGFADLAIPLYLVPDDGTGTTKLIADYSEARIDDWYLAVYGFDSDTHTKLSGALQLLLEEEIAEEFGTVELLELSSWDIGGGDVKIVARELFVQPEIGRITLGMHTNLDLPPSAGLNLETPIDSAAAMTVAFDMSILLTMSHRMLEEGEISRRYDENGNPDPEGTYGVTLSAIDADPTVDKTLRTEFRVWRIKEGYCGFANVEMPLTLALNERRTAIEVSAGEAVLIRGDNEGIGVAAEEEQRLVDENQDLVDTFRKDLSEQVGKTLNYEELAVEGRRILFETQDVVTAPAMISTHIDFLVLARE